MDSPAALGALRPDDGGEGTLSRREHVHRRFLRDFQAGGNLDLFLVAAVSSVLVIRFYLELTGYPRIATGSLHIAHLLWGGAFMLAALVLAVSYLDRAARELAALLGGIGFGTFIDEVGKFVTHDNDYFYRPTPAIIYTVFVLLYLAVRSLHRERTGTREEYLANALQETQELALHDLSAEERDRALFYLERSGSEAPLAEGLRALLDAAEAVEEAPGLPERWRRRAAALYRRIAELRIFAAGVVVFFTVQLLLKLLHVYMLVDPLGQFGRKHIPWPIYGEYNEIRGLVDLGLLASSLLAAAFVALGILHLPASRLRAYRMFQRSILVSILFGQVLMFYRVQWAALAGLAFNLLLFGALRYMIERERSLAYHRRESRIG